MGGQLYGLPALTSVVTRLTPLACLRERIGGPWGLKGPMVGWRGPAQPRGLMVGWTGVGASRLTVMTETCAVQRETCRLRPCPRCHVWGAASLGEAFVGHCPLAAGSQTGGSPKRLASRRRYRHLSAGERAVSGRLAGGQRRRGTRGERLLGVE